MLAISACCGEAVLIHGLHRASVKHQLAMAEFPDAMATFITIKITAIDNNLLPFCAAGAVAAVADYTRVVAVYDTQSETPLQERLRVGLRSAFFSHQAAYAAATVSREPAQEMDALRQAAHNLLDTRLMIAWAKAYADSGDLPRAQYLVARLREFRNPAAADFFEPCATSAPPTPVAQEPLPFQCQPPDPRVMLGWMHFR